MSTSLIDQKNELSAKQTLKQIDESIRKARDFSSQLDSIYKNLANVAKMNHNLVDNLKEANEEQKNLEHLQEQYAKKANEIIEEQTEKRKRENKKISEEEIAEIRKKYQLSQSEQEKLYKLQATQEERAQKIMEAGNKASQTDAAAKAIAQKNLSVTEKIKSTVNAKQRYKEQSKNIKTLLDSGLITNEEYEEANYRANKELEQNSFSFGKLDQIVDGISSVVTAVDTVSAFTKGPLGAVEKFGGQALNLLSKISSQMHSWNQEFVEGVVDIYSSMGRMEARFYGSDKSFASIIEDIKTTVGVNSLVTQRDVLTALEELVDNGITYNVEQRALLSSLSEDLVANFDVMSDSLTRLIRLQQQDNTQAYIGSESLLTSFLNSTFNDTSYLNSMYNSVYDAILDGMSTLNADQASQFNYNVQKWLGALYSVGLSSSAVSMIAAAINDIATGNLDSSSQTLLALAAQRSGTSYASYLTTGVTGDSVNTLLQSMVEYLQSIANNTDSNVVKKQFANLFGLTMSDWTAISNLSTTDIGTIANNTINLATATQETEKLLSETLYERIHTSTKINNLMDNVKYSYGIGIANDETDYLEYVASNLAYKIGDSLGSMMGKVVSVTEAANQQKLLMKGLSSVSDALGVDVKSSALALLTGSDDVISGIGNVISAVMGGAWNTLKSAFVGWDNVDYSGLGHLLSSNISPYLKANLLGSFAMSSSMRTQTTELEGGIEEQISTSVQLTKAIEETTATIGDAAETIQTTQKDIEYINLANEAEKVSATASNIVSGEEITSRSLDDIYAALFENLNNPLRVGIAFYDDRAISQLQSIFDSDYLSKLNTMRA